jgi:hypothetical protein
MFLVRGNQKTGKRFGKTAFNEKAQMTADDFVKTKTRFLGYFVAFDD